MRQTGSDSEHFFAILATKLSVPLLRSQIVTRPRLLEHLHSIPQYPLTLISAPAGSGKTTLLSEWCRAGLAAQLNRSIPMDISGPSVAQRMPSQNNAASAAWLSLDETDNDPITFWHYFIAALATLHAKIGDNARKLLFSTQPFPMQVILAILINSINSLLPESVLILDDYHVIKTQSIHDTLTFFLDHMPAHMHLVIASRSDPSFSLARLRASGRLFEIGMGELRFTREETSALFGTVTGLRLAKKTIAALDKRFEGWIAGLQLLALTLHGRQDSSDFVETIISESPLSRHILDYLAEEVLMYQPENVQDFLLHTSLLHHLNTSLCEMVTGQKDVLAMLEQLEHTNLFIVPLDEERRWYRYHHLFAEFLSTRLHQTQAQLVPILHYRACIWYEQHELFPQAIEHALAAQEWERAASLMELIVDSMLPRGEYSSLQGWLDRLPAEIIRSSPALSLARAFIWISHNALDAADLCLHDAEAALQITRGEEVALQGKLQLTRAFASLRRGNARAALSQYTQGLEHLSQQETLSNGTFESIPATTHFMLGNLQAADEEWTKIIVKSRVSGKIDVTIQALRNLAQLQMVQGQLRQAAATSQEVLQLMTRMISPLPVDGYTHLWLGNIHYEWNDLDRAKMHIGEALVYAKHIGNTEILLPGYAALLRIARAQEDDHAKYELCEQIEQLLKKLNRPEMASRLALYRVQLGLAQDDIEAAVRWSKEAHLSLGDKDMTNALANPNNLSVYLVWAQTLLAQHNSHEALSLLTHIRQHMATHYGYYLTKLLTLQALALAAQSKMAQAMTTLMSTLSLAEQEGYIRTFVDLGLPMAKLLSNLLRNQLLTSLPHTYVCRLLEAFPRAEYQALLPSDTMLRLQAAAPFPKLSEREREVLRLMAQGCSDREIAQQLMLAESSSKTYARRIYTKLGAKNRTQAVMLARELHLL